MKKHHRKSIRLKVYDYSSPGAYFITICTNNHGYLLGDMIEGQMNLNDIGHLFSDEPTPNSIPTIIRGFKSAVTNRVNRQNNTSGLKLMNS